MTRTVLFQFFQAKVIKFFFKSELFKLSLKVNNGLFDPLLTLIAGPLAVFLFELVIPTISPYSLTALLLNAVYSFFQVQQTIPQVLDHHIFVFQFILHDFKNLKFFQRRQLLLFCAAGFGLLFLA